MRVLVPGFEHVPGVSCGPTAVRDVLAAQGLALSEALVFGLGGGLGFYLLSSESGLSRALVGRTFSLEPDLCELLGLEWRELREPDPQLAWSHVRSRVDEGRAVILTTDIAHLPYYDTKTSYNGHRVALAGYDLDAGTALLADTERPGLQEVAIADLATARASEAPMWGAHQHSWYEIHGKPVNEIAEVIPAAVRRNGERMLSDPTGFGGLTGMAHFVADLPRWPSLRDFERCAKEGYYAVEKRGTGGGFFRALFAQFLDEAQALRPELNLKRTAHDYRELAWSWRELGTAMKLASHDRAWDGMVEHAQDLLERERTLAERLASLR